MMAGDFSCNSWLADSRSTGSNLSTVILHGLWIHAPWAYELLSQLFATMNYSYDVECVRNLLVDLLLRLDIHVAVMCNVLEYIF